MCRLYRSLHGLPFSVCRHLRHFSLQFVVAVLVLGLSGAALSQENITVPQVPYAVRNGRATLTGHYDGTHMLRLVIALQPPHIQEEEQYIAQLQDLSSPLFHKYLSEEEWNQRFAPSVEDEQAVAAWAQSQGLTITQRYNNRMLVDVEAPAATIEKALNVTINTYQKGGLSYFSNDQDPSIPASLANVIQSILGLNNFEVMRSGVDRLNSTRPPEYVPGPAYAVGGHFQRGGNQSAGNEHGSTARVQRLSSWDPYTAADIWSPGAYDYSALMTFGHCCNPLNAPNPPPESSIAIAIWGDFNDSDVNSFFSYNNMAADVQRYFVDGRPRCCDEEATLDVEWSTAAAQKANTAQASALVNVYEGGNGYDSTLLDVLNRALSDGHARVLNMSWGASELHDMPASTMDSYHAVFNQMVGQGWTLVAASGDNGSTQDCEDYVAVSYPASDPDVIAVGGTSMNGGQSGFVSERGWQGGTYGCAQNDGGGGGGCSAYFSAPGYQTNHACGTGSRSVPDLALNADADNYPQLFYFGGSYESAGGTSIGSPEVSGFFAQENAYLLYIQGLIGNTCGSNDSSPCAPIGVANWYIYYEGIHAPVAPHYPFYDVTSGCNNNDITWQYNLHYYCASGGYDLVTGWGSANMMQLAWMLNSFVAGDSSAPTISLSGAQPNHWYNTDTSLTWTIADTSSTNRPPNGVAGSSFFWDNDPGDPYREPTPATSGNNTSNPFYIGPTSALTNGSLQLSGMPNGQGCHSAIIRAWDNAGEPAVANSGPLCYDPYPPQTAVQLNGNWQGQYYSGPVQMILTAQDNGGSGVAETLYNVNNGGWQRYTGSFYFAVPGSYVVAFHSVDVAGNVEIDNYVNFGIFSNQQFNLTVTKNGTGAGTVTSSDGAINCGSTCSTSYYDEQQITLTAVPNNGSAFSGWQGCDVSFGYTCTFNMTADRQVKATFNIPVALQFIPVTPCRVADTRWTNGPFGGPSLSGGAKRDFNIPQSNCNIPATAAAYALNVTAVPHTTLGLLTIWSAGVDRPNISIMNSWDGRYKANAAIVPAGGNEAVSVYASDTTDVVLDINGYFVPAGTPSALAFYPMAPCRVSDTRWPQGPLGGPYLAANQQRDLPVQSSQCNIPASALAYAMNFTVIPKNGQPVWVFTAWPAGQPPPATSTLNAPTGTVVANAAILPAGTGGDIDVSASNDTDLAIDINGYFAPPATGGLSLYANVPCRVLDTRQANGAFNGELTVNVLSSNCGVPQAAQALVFNATVVPSGPLWLLALWPDGGNQPNVSTLNSYDAAVTSNMAIIMTTNGSIDADAAGLTQLIMDISSYYAP